MVIETINIAQEEMLFVPRIPLIPNDIPFESKRLQFVLKVYFVMTIKSQGQILKIAAVEFRQDCFSHRQIYIACNIL